MNLQPTVASPLQSDRLLVDIMAAAQNQRIDGGAVSRHAEFLHATV